jgi:hypothetical protein
MDNMGDRLGALGLGEEGTQHTGTGTSTGSGSGLKRLKSSYSKAECLLVTS